MTATAEELPDRRERVLHARQARLFRARVLDEEQPALATQHPAHFRERRRYVGNRAQREGQHDRIEAVVLEGHLLRTDLVQRHGTTHLVGAFARPFQHVWIGLDADQLVDVAVEAEVEAGADADLEHATGRLGHDLTTRRVEGAHRPVDRRRRSITNRTSCFAAPRRSR
jgi:hypothetical protein